MPRSVVRMIDGYNYMDEREPRDVVEVAMKMMTEDKFLRIKPSAEEADGFDYVNPRYILCVNSFRRGANTIPSSVPERYEGSE